MVGQSWIDYPAHTLDTLVLDTTQPAQPDQFIFSRRALKKNPAPPIRSVGDLSPDALYTAQLTVGGRTWSFYYAPTSGWLDSRIGQAPYIVLGGGLLFTILLAAYFLNASRRSELVEQQVN